MHGIEVDTVAMEARLPAEKLTKARDLLSALSRKRRVTLKELQSCLGFLAFACKVIAPGRPFLRRLIGLTAGASRKSHHIALNGDARADITAWIFFLDHYNGISVFPEVDVSSADALNLYFDAAGSLGFGAIFGSKWFYGRWPSDLANMHITIKELFPIVLIAELWGVFLANKRVLFHCDNAAVVAIVNSQSSRDSSVMILVRRLVVALLQHNVIFKASHIPGKTNVVADALSRFQLQAAREKAPWLDSDPTPVPEPLLHLRLKELLGPSFWLP